MGEEDLKGRLEKLSEDIIENSKDTFIAKRLLSDILSIKGQLDVVPSLLELPLSDVEEHVGGDYFDIYKTKDGILYKTKSGYFIYTKEHNKALYYTLMSYLRDNDSMEAMTEEEKKLFDLDMDANGYIFTLPLFIFEDEEFKLKIATEVVEHLRKKFEELNSMELQDETPEADEEYRKSVLAMENISNS